MNSKIWKIGPLILAGVLLLSGCGEKLTKLTAEEENNVVNYSAYVIGEFNKDQKKGYTPIGESVIEKYRQREQSQNGNQTSSSEIPSSQDQDSGERDTGTETDKIVNSGTIDDAIGLTQLTASYTSYEVENSYVENDAYLLSADKGYTYIVLHISVSNPTKSALKLDMLSKTVQFVLQVNDIKVPSATTMLLNDLSTYSETVKAGDTVKTVLLFPIKEEAAEEIQSMNLTVLLNKSETTVNLIH